jgi:ferredoxin
MQIMLVGEERPVPALPGDTILDALLRAGVAFPFSCQSGNCGACKCELVSGDIVAMEHSAQALGSDEQAQGLVLACRSQLFSDAVVRLVYTQA